MATYSSIFFLRTHENDKKRGKYVYSISYVACLPVCHSVSICVFFVCYKYSVAEKIGLSHLCIHQWSRRAQPVATTTATAPSSINFACIIQKCSNLAAVYFFIIFKHFSSLVYSIFIFFRL